MTWNVGMPNLGHTMDEGKVSEWLKKPGDLVRAGEVIAIVESDKAAFDIESPADGMLVAIKAKAGQTVPVGAVIGIVGRPGKPRRSPDVAAPEGGGGAAAAVAPAARSLPTAQLVGFWRDMMRIRLFERAAIYQSSLGKIYGALHSYEGQESCAVGICSALQPGDYAASTHRGHGHCIAMGARMDRMMAELFGRETGYCRGKGGSLHIADLGAGMLGANGIVGAGYSIAAGAALSAKVQGNGRVAVVFFGDGAVTRGPFHEVMNMASLWRLPLLFVCENNGLAQYVHTKDTMVFDSIASLAASYRMPGVRIDGNDVAAVHRAAVDAVVRARGGDGPTLLELTTQRFMGHSSGDPQVYRTKEQVQQLREARDPLTRIENDLAAIDGFSRRAALLAEIEAEVAEAVRFADASPYPADSALLEDVYAT
ncbi:MAG TPA: thiamine pyrophosphate-dependent enzyme [Burkholderiaceae bacterium]|nr:thiamine pyrophosphate-dependent enzyme [Burkholderiaceae bacterium]